MTKLAEIKNVKCNWPHYVENSCNPPVYHKDNRRLSVQGAALFSWKLTVETISKTMNMWKPSALLTEWKTLEPNWTFFYPISKEHGLHLPADRTPSAQNKKPSQTTWWGVNSGKFSLSQNWGFRNSQLVCPASTLAVDSNTSPCYSRTHFLDW